MRIDLLSNLSRKGFALYSGVLPSALTQKLRQQLESNLHEEEKWHNKHDVPYATKGALLNAISYGGAYLDLLDQDDFLEPFITILGQDFHLYILSSASVPPGERIYTDRIHVDSHRHCSDQQIILAAMIFLSEVQTSNGPLFLPGSFSVPDQPERKEFVAGAERISGKAGDVLYFNPKTWHSGSPNPEASWRHALTIGFCRSFVRQRFDFARQFASLNPQPELSPRQQRLLGITAPTPASYAEYYGLDRAIPDPGKVI